MGGVIDQETSLMDYAPLGAAREGVSESGTGPEPWSWRILTSPEHWDAEPLRRDWRTLAERSGNPDVMYQSPEWFDYLRARGEAGGLAVAVLEGSGGQIRGVVPLRLAQERMEVHVGHRRAISIPVRQLIFLGGKPLTPDDPAVLEPLFRVASSAFPQAQGFGFPALETGASFRRALMKCPLVQEDFFLYQVEEDWDYHVLPLPPTFPEYFARYDGKKRYNLRRQARQIQELGGGPLELRRIELPHEMEDFVAASKILARMHPVTSHLKWETDPEPNRVRDYRLLAERGLMRCYRLQCGSELVGCIGGTHYLGRQYLGRILYNTRFANYSPAVTMLNMVIEDLIDRCGMRVLNFGFGTVWAPVILRGVPPCGTRVLNSDSGTLDRDQQSNPMLRYSSVLLLRRTVANRMRWLIHSSARASKHWFLRMLIRSE